MTKDEVSGTLGMSLRAVERAHARGQLDAVKIKKLNGGFRLDFTTESVERLRLEREGMVTPLPPVAPSTAIARREDVAAFAAVVERFAAVFESQSAATTTTPPPGAVAVECKLVLSLAEAAAVSGVPRGRLRAAIDAGALKAFNGTLGRGFRVRRQDLDRWVSELT